MKRQLTCLLQRQSLFLTTYTGRERSGGPRKTDLSGMVKLCIREVKDSPCYLLYDK